MAIDFWDAIKLNTATCVKCMNFSYTVPCRVDSDIVKHFKSFGKPLYPLSAVRLFRIDCPDGHKVESKLGKNAVKLAIPKTLKGTDLDKTSRKLEFEKCLAAWVSEVLDIPITIESQGDINDEG